MRVGQILIIQRIFVEFVEEIGCASGFRFGRARSGTRFRIGNGIEKRIGFRIFHHADFQKRRIQLVKLIVGSRFGEAVADQPLKGFGKLEMQFEKSLQVDMKRIDWVAEIDPPRRVLGGICKYWSRGQDRCLHPSASKIGTLIDLLPIR